VEFFSNLSAIPDKRIRRTVFLWGVPAQVPHQSPGVLQAGLLESAFVPSRAALAVAVRRGRAFWRQSARIVHYVIFVLFDFLPLGCS
jgi:hypothetical protein